MELANIKWKAIIYGVASYIGMWVLWNLAGPFIFSDFNNSVSESENILFQIFNLLAALISGYVAARVARVQLIMHSIVAGIVLWLGIIIFWYSFGALEVSALLSTLFVLVVLVTMSTLGGFVAKWQSLRN
jgi:hypothetical protein